MSLSNGFNKSTEKLTKKLTKKYNKFNREIFIIKIVTTFQKSVTDDLVFPFQVDLDGES